MARAVVGPGSSPGGRPAARVVVGLGSNLGDRRALIAGALERLGEVAGVTLLRRSSLYETAPVGPPQPDYLNAVAELESLLPPRELLEALLAVEASLGRIREPATRDAPRTIDLDLLWYEGVELATPELTLPHPRLHQRAFVLVPLAELLPGLPVRGRAVREWLERLPPTELASVRIPGPR